MLWDRGEAAGYAQHMTSDPLPNTPTHEVMLQVAFADHQVANVSAEVEGAHDRRRARRRPPCRPACTGRLIPAFGFRTVSGNHVERRLGPGVLVRRGKSA